jgi:hypothetical protein
MLASFNLVGIPTYIWVNILEKLSVGEEEFVIIPIKHKRRLKNSNHAFLAY